MDLFTKYYILESMSRCVYKCVCKQFSERLFADLLQTITSHLEQVYLSIQVCEVDILLLLILLTCSLNYEKTKGYCTGFISVGLFTLKSN